ncbi:VWA domain-containing protein [Tropicimonas marinistellae]|uniref:VWA domain-containing protein n=1 Tax=Tropicimonas marinistellae TaxID=1739787 RepID=UPI000832DF81|nr:VWA domain-containing protein [Tropicimonas marinistellae]
MMDRVLDAIAALHLLRPIWCLLLPVVAFIWWRVRRRQTAGEKPPTGIAPHLAEALTVGAGGARRIYAIDGVALALCLTILAAAGPTWSRVPNPLLAQTAPLVVALKVSESMQAPDVPPNRLERARFKILDLVNRRAGARTALIAYAGTAHRVAPLTDDPNILRAMLEALSPEVMPVPGDNATAALAFAREDLASSETPGAILFVLDALNSADAAAFAETDADADGPPVLFLQVAPEGDPGAALSQIPPDRVIRLTADDSDLAQIERAAESAYRAALLGDERLDWDDRGWMLGWLVVPLFLLWFRRGWTMRWALLLAAGLGAGGAAPARADPVDWFFTPDQQGMMAYRNKDFARAGELFLDPMWRAQAMFRAGQYPAAADVYARLDTAAAAFGEGMARTRNREYRPAIAAYERALELQPDFPEAAWNLEVTKAILDFVETAREQSDTGEEAGIGADDVVFDNEAQRGAETQKDYAQEEAQADFQTADQWMRSVDTDMGDFLRQRFLQENAAGEASE